MRKIILSRKGFDSSWGGHPSPRLGARLVSLPIPVPPDAPPGADRVRFADLRAPDGAALLDRMRALGMRALTAGGARVPLDAHTRCHLDPDLAADALPRPPGWRGVFGQCDAAEGHLAAQGVGPGDLFLFFGVFREAGPDGWRPGAPREHVVFGYLQVGEVVRTRDGASAAAWAWHPHAAPPYARPGRANALYGAAERLSLPDTPDDAPPLPGHGLLEWRPDRVLTAPGARSHTHWALPAALAGQEPTYHGGPAYGWGRVPAGSAGNFRSAARGQEFVLDATPAARAWARGLIGG